MSGFTSENHSAVPPPGSVMQYFGKQDPDGWIICDGQTRTCTDNRYVNLAALLNSVLGVGTNNSNSITPPDLRSKFLYGSSNTTVGIGTNTGKTTHTLAEMKCQRIVIQLPILVILIPIRSPIPVTDIHLTLMGLIGLVVGLGD